MAFSPIQRSQPMRIMGLASGFDTDYLIGQMMRAHQMRIDNRFRARTILEWKQQNHNSVRDSLVNLRNSFLRTGASTANLLNRNTYNSIVTSIVNAKTGLASNAVSIFAPAGAPTGTIKVLEALKAQGISYTSKDRITGATMNSTLASLGIDTSLVSISNDIVKESTFNLSATGNLVKDNFASLTSQLQAAYGDQVTITDETDGSTTVSVDLPTGYGISQLNINSYDTLSLITSKIGSITGATASVGSNGVLSFSLPQMDRGGPISFDMNTFAADVTTIVADINSLYGASADYNSVTDMVTLNMPNPNGSIGTLTFKLSEIVNGNPDYDSDLFDRVSSIFGADGTGAVSYTAHDVPARTINFDLGGTARNVINAGGTIDEFGAVTFTNSNATFNIADSISAINTSLGAFGNIDYNNGSIHIIRNDSGDDYDINLGGPLKNVIDEIKKAGGNITSAGAASFKDQVSGTTININLTAADIGDELRTQIGSVPGITINPSDTSVTLRSSGSNSMTAADLGVDDNTTVRDFISKVNNSLLGVTLSFDELAQRFKIESSSIGNFNMNVSGLTNIGLGGTHGVDTIETAGTEGRATIVVNGMTEYYTDLTSNDITLGGGVKLTINGDIALGVDEDVIVEIKRDATEPINQIKSFIEGFNALFKRLEDMLKDKKGINEKGYTPLTDEEKSMMTEKQVEEWEAIAKKGIMRNDPGLSSFVNRLRNEIYAQVGRVEKETGYYFLGFSHGQITINEDRLRAALEDDYEKVADFFSGIETVDGKLTGTGMFHRLNDMMGNYINEGQTQSLKNLENSIRQTNLQMEKLTQRMYAEEDRLYKQFAAMETALSKLNQQSDWFSAMLGGNK
ncbi:MAG: flagellar filament capping protein FliD [Oscillospiraceae bacterium]|nr:flagellar filament capping protein FliD [Oscillospiraceae bacterium]